jgi:hypothetical protein
MRKKTGRLLLQSRKNLPQTHGKRRDTSTPSTDITRPRYESSAEEDQAQRIHNFFLGFLGETMPPMHSAYFAEYPSP